MSAIPLSDVFRFCVYCGNKLQDIDGIAFECSSCSKKSYVSPAVGCNCVILNEDRCLMVQRARDPDAGTWSLPGGFSHPNESCEQTMIREAYEELHVQIAVDTIIGTDYCTYVYDGIARPVLVVYGVGKILSGDIVCQDDAADYLWAQFDQIQNLPLFHSFEVEIIKKGLGLS